MQNVEIRLLIRLFVLLANLVLAAVDLWAKHKLAQFIRLNSRAQFDHFSSPTIPLPK